MSATRRTASDWRALIAEHRKSGQTRAVFAAERQIHPNTLAWWTTHLRRKDEALLPTFTEIQLAPPAPVPVQPLTVCLGDSSLRILVPSGFCADDLRRLVATLC